MFFFRGFVAADNDEFGSLSPGFSLDRRQQQQKQQHLHKHDALRRNASDLTNANMHTISTSHVAKLSQHDIFNRHFIWRLPVFIRPRSSFFYQPQSIKPNIHTHTLALAHVQPIATETLHNTQ